jgi:micrococcal nuclease
MVREGFAFEYTYKKPYQYQSDFKKVETEAKKLMKGLWSESTCNGRP